MSIAPRSAPSLQSGHRPPVAPRRLYRDATRVRLAGLLIVRRGRRRQQERTNRGMRAGGDRGRWSGTPRRIRTSGGSRGVGRTRGKARRSSGDLFGSFKGYEATAQPQAAPTGSLAPNDHVKPVVGSAQTDFYPVTLDDRRDGVQDATRAATIYVFDVSARTSRAQCTRHGIEGPAWGPCRSTPAHFQIWPRPYALQGEFRRREHVHRIPLSRPQT
jgi:hypothetical protein